MRRRITYSAKSDLQKDIDAGALAGANALVDDYLKPKKSFDSKAESTLKNFIRDV